MHCKSANSLSYLGKRFQIRRVMYLKFKEASHWRQTLTRVVTSNTYIHTMQYNTCNAYIVVTAACCQNRLSTDANQFSVA